MHDFTNEDDDNDDPAPQKEIHKFQHPNVIVHKSKPLNVVIQ